MHDGGSLHPRAPYHIFSLSVQKLKSGRCSSGASGPSTCALCIQRVLSSAYFGSTLTAPGAPLASAGVRSQARLHITAARPIVGGPIFRPWPVCRWRLQQCSERCSTSSTFATFCKHGQARPGRAGRDCGEAIREAGPLHFSRSLHDEPHLLPYSLAPDEFGAKPSPQDAAQSSSLGLSCFVPAKVATPDRLLWLF
jgi:hypothetical protein